MHLEGYLSLKEAADFLGLSRPTLNARRKMYTLREFRPDGRTTLLKKSDLLNLYAKEHPVQSSLNLLMTEDDKVGELAIDSNTFDLRKINLFDSYGIVSLLIASIKTLEEHSALYFIVEDNIIISTLSEIGFFDLLEKRFKGRIFWNEGVFPHKVNPLTVFASLKYIAIRGQERKFLEDLTPLLQKQGFLPENIGYLTWFLGELADNALTHAQGPCYIVLGQFGTADSKSNFFEIAIGDAGKGIFSSLKENPKYSALPDEVAFIKAFQSMVSSWPDDQPRGKGLSDVLSLAIGCGSLLRVDSKDKGLFFNFSSGQKELQVREPLYSKGGARFCWLFINNTFKGATRQEVDNFIKQEVESRA